MLISRPACRRCDAASSRIVGRRHAIAKPARGTWLKISRRVAKTVSRASKARGCQPFGVAPETPGCSHESSGAAGSLELDDEIDGAG